MRVNPWVILGVASIGFLAWKAYQAQAAQAAALTVAPGASPLQALTTGLEAGIAAGTYDASALRNQMVTAPFQLPVQ